ncbi:MAG: alkane 1-monooxygenase [Woeseiaceae bacterium]|nr:alkane 1-monooxygenase [Woeseiaceae bacterium]
MKGYTATTRTGEAVHYVDGKRYLWLLSVLFPLQPFIGIALHAKYGVEWVFAVPLLLTYALVPLLDAVTGQDPNNPPEEVVMQLNRDKYYRYLTYAVVPVHFVMLLVGAWYASTQGLGIVGFVLLTTGIGLSSGLAINTGHELGHKNSVLEKQLAKIVLAIPAYGHFALEHNRGHHRDVSTPEDPASARMGESIYRFALREIPGAFWRAWQMESERLGNRGKSAWHPDNQILQSYALSAIIAIVLVATLGLVMIPFLLLHHFVAYWQLTSANYIEHYGLLRLKGDNGRYERCRPHHSWNTNHIVSNLALFHLQRHSDHHTNPLRRYQSLRNFDDLPTLPNGYFGCFVLALFPQLWFRVMDRRLLALPHIGGDLEKVNIDPGARAAIFLRYGQQKMAEPTIG